MTQQSEALRLADALDVVWAGGIAPEAAAELRRLSEIETLYLAAMRGRPAMSEELLALTAQRDALLEALKDLMQQYKDQPECFMDWSTARAAIKQAEGENT